MLTILGKQEGDIAHQIKHLPEYLQPIFNNHKKKTTTKCIVVGTYNLITVEVDRYVLMLSDQAAHLDNFHVTERPFLRQNKLNSILKRNTGS